MRKVIVVEEKYYLGFDAGTQSVKVAVYDDNLNEVAIATKMTTLIYPQPGWVQMDVNEYYEKSQWNPMDIS